MEGKKNIYFGNQNRRFPGCLYFSHFVSFLEFTRKLRIRVVPQFAIFKASLNNDTIF